jgi:L-gulonate 3-dehydrogenase
MLVAIVGTGLIGKGWAVAFARAGWQVRLWDSEPRSAHGAASFAKDALREMARMGLVEAVEEKLSGLTVAADLGEAVAGVDYVQESVPENAETKRNVFEAIDRLAQQGVPIGSSSSTIPGSRFLSDIPGRSRCIVAHPANPPHLMPVVEVVPSPWHEKQFVRRVCDILESIGQVPVVIQKEVEGFVMNRLQTAVVNEAVALVAQGVVDPAGLDAIMKHSLGLRWAFLGPFETMDLNAPNGFQDYASRYGHLYQAMGRQLHVADAWPSEALQQIEDARRTETPREAVAKRMQWRDLALMQLLALKQKIHAS